jgi:hypothetical protein
MRRVQPGQLGYRRHCQGIGHVRGRGRSSQGAVQRSKIGNGTTHHRKVELEGAETLPLPRRPRCVTLVKPQRHSNGDRLVEREVGELVSECAVHVVDIGPQQDGTRTRNCDCCPPLRSTTAGERVHPPCIGDHNQPERTGKVAAEAGPLSGFCSAPSEVGGQTKLARPGHGRHLPYPHCHWLGLEQRREGATKDAAYDQESGLRGTSPPAAATSSISWQRLAQGLNLLALYPSVHALTASSRSPPSHSARPSSK